MVVDIYYMNKFHTTDRQTLESHNNNIILRVILFFGQLEHGIKAKKDAILHW